MRDERTAVRWALAGAAAAGAIFLVAAQMGGAAWRAWLGAAVLCGAAPTGALSLAMMIRLIPGSWRTLAAPLDRTLGLLPLGALAMAPVLVAPGRLYSWVQAPATTPFRSAWLSPLGFGVRGALWFALLMFLSVRLHGARPGRVAIAGLIGLTVAGLPMAADWLMSLDPGFASSGFGLYWLAIEIALGLSLAVTMASPTADAGTRDVLGGVLLTAVAIWAYLGFMAYFIIWSGDLPAGVAWYLRRGGPWASLAWLAIVLKGAGAAPLIFGPVRRNSRALAACATATAAGAIPEIAWLVLPAPGPPAGPWALAIFAAATLALAVSAAGLCSLARLRREAAS